MTTSIILLGTGAMAETIINILPNNIIYIVGRNQKRIELFLQNHKNMKIYKDINTNQNICLINTTPLGTNEEDLLRLFNIKYFDKAIDLPYTTKETKLSVFCKINNIPIIDGKMFWKLQADKQLQKFRSVLTKIK